MDLPEAIKTERLAIANRLETLTAEQWAAPTCCDQWSVLEVAAHLTQGWNYSTAHGMFQMLKARGDLGKVSAGCIASLAAAGPEAVPDGLHVSATNQEWSWGEGEEVTGPALPLAHALWGRIESLPELDGPGVQVLEDRLATR